MKVKALYIKEGDTINEVAIDKAIALFAKEQGIKKPEAEEFIKDVLKGDNEYDYEGVEPDDAKAHKAHAKAAAKFVEESEKNKKALSQALLDAEEEDKKRKEKLVVAAEKGATAADKFGLSIATDFQKLLGPKFVANQYGLSLAKGQAVSEDDLSSVISVLAEGSEKVNELRSQTLIKLGDAARIVRKELGDEKGDELITQAIEVRGQGKHNVMQSEAVVSYIDSLYDEQKDRPVALSFTHWQEAKNYGRNKDGSNAIAPAKVKKILEKAVAEKLSCADLRDLLKAARPAKEGEEGAGGEGEGEDESSTPKAKEAKALFGFVFLNMSDPDDITFTEELDKDMLKEKDGDSQKYLVFDLAGKCTLKPSGKSDAAFKEVTEASEEVEEEAAE